MKNQRLKVLILAKAKKFSLPLQKTFYTSRLMIVSREAKKKQRPLSELRIYIEHH